MTYRDQKGVRPAIFIVKWRNPGLGGRAPRQIERLVCEPRHLPPLRVAISGTQGQCCVAQTLRAGGLAALATGRSNFTPPTWLAETSLFILLPRADHQSNHLGLKGSLGTASQRKQRTELSHSSRRGALDLPLRQYRELLRVTTWRVDCE